MQVNQLLVGVHSVAACEAMLLAEKLGVTDQQALHEVLQTATGCSEVLKRHMPVIAARYAHLPHILNDVKVEADG